MMEQVRLCAVWPMENWLGSSLNQIQGWTTVRESYSRALEQGPLPSPSRLCCISARGDIYCQTGNVAFPHCCRKEERGASKHCHLGPGEGERKVVFGQKLIFSAKEQEPNSEEKGSIENCTDVEESS